MSMYINGYLRTKDDKFIPLFSYSRSSNFYQVAQKYAPWEKISAITKENLQDIRAELEELKTEFESRIARYNNEITIIQQMNNSVDDKMEAINDHLNLIDEEKEDAKYLDYDIARILLLESIIDENTLSEYTENENARPANEIIYFGTESGYNVTIDDIV